MLSNNHKNKLNKVIKDFNFASSKEYKLIVLFGLLGDFDSFEYAINLKDFIDFKERDIIESYIVKKVERSI